MNFGDCPYCEQFIGFMPVPDKTPAYAKVSCESCGKEVWYKFSRIDPVAYTVEDFEATHVIDHVARTITEK